MSYKLLYEFGGRIGEMGTGKRVEKTFDSLEDQQKHLKMLKELETNDTHILFWRGYNFDTCMELLKRTKGIFISEEYQGKDCEDVLEQLIKYLTDENIEFGWEAYKEGYQVWLIEE